MSIQYARGVLEECCRNDDAFVTVAGGVAFGSEVLARKQSCERDTAVLLICENSVLRQVLPASARPSAGKADHEPGLVFGSRYFIAQLTELAQVAAGEPAKPPETAGLDLVVLSPRAALCFEPRLLAFLVQRIDFVLVASAERNELRQLLASAIENLSCRVAGIVAGRLFEAEFIPPPEVLACVDGPAAGRLLALAGSGALRAETREYALLRALASTRRAVGIEREKWDQLLAVRRAYTGTGSPAPSGGAAELTKQVRVFRQSARELIDRTTVTLTQDLDLGEFEFNAAYAISGLEASDMQRMERNSDGKFVPCTHSRVPWLFNRVESCSLNDDARERVLATIRHERTQREQRDSRAIEQAAAAIETRIESMLAPLRNLGLSPPPFRTTALQVLRAAPVRGELKLDASEPGEIIVHSVLSYIRQGQSLAQAVFGMIGLMFAGALGAAALFSGGTASRNMGKFIFVVVMFALGYAIHRYRKAKGEHAREQADMFETLKSRMMSAVTATQRSLTGLRGQAVRDAVQTFRSDLDRFDRVLEDLLEHKQAGLTAALKEAQLASTVQNQGFQDRQNRLRTLFDQLGQAATQLSRPRERMTERLRALAREAAVARASGTEGGSTS